MKTLDLTLQEHGLLVRLLEKYHTDLDHEISHTDHAEFKNLLRQRQLVIVELLGKLKI